MLTLHPPTPSQKNAPRKKVHCTKKWKGGIGETARGTKLLGEGEGEGGGETQKFFFPPLSTPPLNPSSVSPIYLLLAPPEPGPEPGGPQFGLFKARFKNLRNLKKYIYNLVNYIYFPPKNCQIYCIFYLPCIIIG